MFDSSGVQSPVITGHDQQHCAIQFQHCPHRHVDAFKPPDKSSTNGMYRFIHPDRAANPFFLKEAHMSG
jgi:hypothetical protein